MLHLSWTAKGKPYFTATLGGYMKRLPFLKVLVKVLFQYHLPIKSYGDFNVTDLTYINNHQPHFYGILSIMALAMFSAGDSLSLIHI